MRVICEGCGQVVPVPPGYRRNKIQCACGVICAVPESARQEAEAPAPARPAPTARPAPAEEEAERWLLDDEPPKAPSSEPPALHDPEPELASEPEAKKETGLRFPCRRCRRLIRRQGECPYCNPEKAAAAEGQEPVWWPSVDEADDEAEEDEEEAAPYGVEGADEVPCPKCSFRLPPGSVVCVRCGYDLKKRKKIARTYQPIDRQWETNASLQTRLTVYGGILILSLALGLTGVFWGGADLGVFVGSFLVLSLMLAFLLGTYACIRLTRDTRGRVQITRTWRACFYPLQPKTQEVRGFEGISSGRFQDSGAWEYMIFFVLFVSGIIPGIIWWYFAIHKTTFHVSLTRDHGFPEYLVYNGWDEMQMKEIAFTLRDASGLLYDEG